MDRSSSSMGAIAGALAKAQSEILNPEKTLTATIRTPLAPNGERTFRYASLASGLDIVRKCLGKHEIAVIQQTTIDAEAKLVKLITMLAHTSGEWVSSDWPVCPINEIASPHRMGAALTYARRYALFALVGIAGEDDLDAPDFPANPLTTNDARTSQAGEANGKIRSSASSAGTHIGRMLPPEQSATTRDQLIASLDTLSTSQELTDWAHHCLPIKNTLSERDAQILENAFHRKLAAAADNAQTYADDEAGRIESSPPPNEKNETNPKGRRRQYAQRLNRRSEQPNSSLPQLHNQPPHLGIDKSLLAIPTIKRHRRKEHLRLVAREACLVCGREPSDAHHLRFAQPRGLGLKVSDEFTVPLCRIHHRDVHRHRDERDWWRARNIEPLKVAHKLWQTSMGSNEKGPEKAGPRNVVST